MNTDTAPIVPIMNTTGTDSQVSLSAFEPRFTVSRVSAARGRKDYADLTAFENNGLFADPTARMLPRPGAQYDDQEQDGGG